MKTGTDPFSDKATLAVDYEYDRLGRKSKTIQGDVITHYKYGFYGEMLGESYSGGKLDGISVTNEYDDQLRRGGLTVNGTKGKDKRPILATAQYTYDEVSRLKTVGDGKCEVEYSYLENSPLVEHIEYRNGEDVRMTTRKQYDRLSRLTLIETQTPNYSPVRFAYEYNAANQRTKAVREDKSAWNYSYDELGQVTSGHKTDGNEKSINQYDYTYDSIGNRKKVAVNGDEATYESDNLNRLTSRKALKKKASDQIAPMVSKAEDSTETGSIADVAKDAEFQYDDDGNLLNDGQWQHTWDAENRLIAIESLPAISPVNRKRLEFTYDAQSRRIGKRVCQWDSDHWTMATNLHFVYDGWNLIAEFNSTSDQKLTITNLKSYLWGLDLSGSIQGAGGVGGLLTITDRQSHSSFYFASYDGNGNIVGLISAIDGLIVSSTEYDPFGVIVKSTKMHVNSISFGFSTKYTDEETAHMCYGFRYYNPMAGKWISRDPLVELINNRNNIISYNKTVGFKDEYNLYAFVSNDPISYVDLYGLLDWLIVGGKCCNSSGRNPEWAIVSSGSWRSLAPGQCTGLCQDCDGMTCKGGFYYISNLEIGNCSSGPDDSTMAPRRWPGGENALSPTQRGAATPTPPNYVFD